MDIQGAYVEDNLYCLSVHFRRVREEVKIKIFSQFFMVFTFLSFSILIKINLGSRCIGRESQVCAQKLLGFSSN